jgi:hypothetical protein
MLKAGNSTDVPSSVDVSRESFLKYRDGWKLYRSLGRHDGAGNWIPPISFTEAIEMPAEMLNVFQELDHFLAQMQRHQAAKRGNK